MHAGSPDVHRHLLYKKWTDPWQGAGIIGKTAGIIGKIL